MVPKATKISHKYSKLHYQNSRGLETKQNIILLSNLSIFIAFTEAFCDEMDSNQLEEQLKEAVARALTRLRSKRYKLKKKMLKEESTFSIN